MKFFFSSDEGTGSRKLEQTPVKKTTPGEPSCEPEIMEIIEITEFGK